MRLHFRLIEKFVEHSDAQERGVQVHMHAGQTFGGLIGQQDCGDEGEEGARRLAIDDDAQAPVNNDHGDGEAAQSLHHGARACAHRRQLVRRPLKLADGLGLAGAHLLFQREGLDDANALHRLLHRFHDLREADEFRGHDLADAHRQFARADHRDRHEDQRQRGHQGILDDHDAHQADEGQRVARQGGDHHIQGVGGGLGDEGLPRDEIRGVPRAEVPHGHGQHLVEHAPLNIRHNGVGDPGKGHLLAIGREALQQADEDEEGGDLPQGGHILGDEHLVDDIFHHPGGGGGRGRHGGHAQEGESVATPMPRSLFAQQTTDQRKGAGRIFQQSP